MKSNSSDIKIALKEASDRLNKMSHENFIEILKEIKEKKPDPVFDEWIVKALKLK